MKQDQNQNADFREYGQQKVHQMVMMRYKSLRSGGILQSLQDIFNKDNYVFSLDNIKNHIEERINDKSRLQKMQGTLFMQTQQLNEFYQRYLNQKFERNALYSEKLKSSLPIFKSIQFLRYQDNEKQTQYFGEEKAFIVDQQNIDFSLIKFDINKIKLFLEDEQIIPKIHLEFMDQNSLQVKYDRFPTLHEIEKRADVMAKLLLFNIFTDQHRKLKQIWKNDEKYHDMKKNEKKLKAFMEPQKSKQGQNEQEQELLKLQVKKVLRGIEERANIIANDQFKQLNGQKAVITKKSLQKLKSVIDSQRNPRLQLKYLIAYKQKKSW